MIRQFLTQFKGEVKEWIAHLVYDFLISKRYSLTQFRTFYNTGIWLTDLNRRRLSIPIEGLIKDSGAIVSKGAPISYFPFWSYRSIDYYN